MARRPAAPPPPQPPLALARPRSEVTLRLQERIDLGKQLQARELRTYEDTEAYKRDSVNWTEYNEELLKRLFTNETLSEEYKYSGGPVSMVFGEDDAWRMYRETTDNHIAKLQSISDRLELYPGPVTHPGIARDTAQSRDFSKVFVVHGHDEGAREAVARFLEKIELEAIILKEQPDQGLTIIEKFESYASQVGFAVVLLTPDDLSAPTSAPAQTSRARQNVIFELGYFAGKLGRGRACLLRKGEVEIPSDLYGVIYTDMDASDGWKLKLARELKAAGLKFDGDKVFG